MRQWNTFSYLSSSSSPSSTRMQPPAGRVIAPSVNLHSSPHTHADLPCSCTDLLTAPALSAEASQRIILMLSGEFCAIESFTCYSVSHPPGSSVARPKQQSMSPARLLNGLSVPTFVSGNGLSAAAGYLTTEKHDILEPIQLPQPQGIFLQWLHVST